MTAITLPAAARAGVTPIDVVALQYGNRNKLLGVPAIVLGAVVLLSVLIALSIVRAGGDLSGMRYNSGVAWSLAGYMVALGVQNVTASFPFALALGSTRRAFVLGNLLTSVSIAGYVTITCVALLAVEVATGGWFVGASVFRATVVGGGDAVATLGVAFLSVLTALAVGGVFGASWTRFGPLGPTVLGIGAALVGALLLLLLLPQVAAVLAVSQPWWLAVVAVVVIAVSQLCQYLLLRGASVR